MLEICFCVAEDAYNEGDSEKIEGVYKIHRTLENSIESCSLQQFSLNLN